MLPLATHCHTHYHLHPFDFVLIKFKVLVAKQCPTNTTRTRMYTHTSHTLIHTHIPHTHTHTPHTHSYTHTTHTHTPLTHSYTQFLYHAPDDYFASHPARHQVNFMLEHFQCSFNVDVDVWDIPTTIFIFVINLLFIHNLGDFCFCFSVI